MNKSLTRSTGYWLLLAFSLALAGVGGWMIADQVGTMASTLLDGTATGIEVYVGQSLVVVGAALLGAGILGLLLALTLTVAQSLVAARNSVTPAPTDSHREESDSREAVITPGSAEAAETTTEGSELDELTDHDPAEADDAQNGSSGSMATATKISVR